MNNKENIQPSHASTSKAKKKRGFLFWASLSVMVASVIALGVIGLGYLEGCMMYDDLSGDAFDDGNLNLADMKVDWDELLRINPDTIGWIYVPGTKVNYPVVHTTDNDKYLHTNFRGYTSYISYGSIFMDCNNKHDISDQNIVLYGHNMNDGTMFTLFRTMKDGSIFNANRNIYFLTPAGNYRLKSFTICHVKGTEKIIQTNFGTDANRIKYIKDKIDRCIVEVEGQIPDPAAMTKIFTFSTCDNVDRSYRQMCFAYVAESTVDGVPGLE